MLVLGRIRLLIMIWTLLGRILLPLDAGGGGVLIWIIGIAIGWNRIGYTPEAG